MKATQEIKNDMNLALVRGSAVSGTNSVAAQTAGFLNLAGTYFTAQSGSTLTERRFNDAICLTYGHTMRLREFYGPMLLKRTLDGFTTTVQRYLPADGKRQVNMINVYESNVGILSLFLERDHLEAANHTSAGNSWIAIDPDYFAKAWLRTPTPIAIAKEGDRSKEFIAADMGLVAKSRKAYAGMTGAVAYLP